ncbi:MAG: branched-chain amino acid ABC transporter permease [Clostridia bacterium]|nr:branched-chain amino acid ABC transporter permease [Clostridia bacterium]
MAEIKQKNKITNPFKGSIEKTYTFFDNKKARYLTLAIASAFLVFLPLTTSIYTQEIMTKLFFYIVVCLGLNIIVGFAGLLHLGYAAFFAVGAYTTGILSSVYGINFWLTLPISIFAAILAGLAIGFPTLRLRGDYLAIVTLGFGEIIRFTARNIKITGGAMGLIGIERPILFGMVLSKITHFYYMFFILVIIAIFLSYRLYESRIGRAWQYIREDEDAASAMGINVVTVRLYAFIIGSAFGALAGSFWAAKMTAISPDSFMFIHSVTILLAVVLGGMGKIPGVVLGAIIVTLFPELSRGIGQYRMIIFAILLLLLMLYRPQGIWPERQTISSIE